MPISEEIRLFHERHPCPDQEGVTSLFRFSGIENQPVEYLKELLVKGRLYHAVPSQFNDPFECKPHFNWPQDALKVREIRKYLVRLAREEGRSKKRAEKFISKNMKKDAFIKETIYSAILNSFSDIRICSFTKTKDNLLFWSHYANSHRGFCLEYDATIMPAKFAFKVSYDDKYPEVSYPGPGDERELEPALIKSKIWEYEEEYRTVFSPEADIQLKNDGESLLLSGSEILNIYFGANVKASNRKLILDLIEQGPFNPKVYDARLSKSDFKLEFFHDFSNSK